MKVRTADGKVEEREMVEVSYVLVSHPDGFKRRVEGFGVPALKKGEFLSGYNVDGMAILMEKPEVQGKLPEVHGKLLEDHKMRALAGLVSASKNFISTLDLGHLTEEQEDAYILYGIASAACRDAFR